MGWANKLVGWASGNGAEVDANNRLKVNLDTGANPAQVGGVRFFSENDAASNYISSPETDDDARLRVGVENVYDWETFNYTAQNTGKFIYRNTTMANAWTTGGLLTNSGSITTTGTGTLLQTYGFYPLVGASQLYGEFEASVSTAATANVVVDMGFFLANTSQPYAPTDGVYFRLNSSGWLGVINYNGAETTTSVFSFTHTINRKYQFIIVAHEREVEFWIDNVLYGTLDTPVGQGQPFMSASLPVSLRHGHTGTAGAAIQFTLTDYTVSVGGPIFAEPAGVVGNRALGSYQSLSGWVMGQLSSYANSTNPTAAAPSNTALTANLPSGLGGQGAVTAAAAAATDGIWGSFQNPAGTVSFQGRRLKITGVRVDAVNMGAAVATTATTLQFCLAFGHTAVSLATAEAATTKAPRRLALGMMNWPIGAAIGAGPDKGPIDVKFDSPVYVNPGEFVQLVGKFLNGTATASQVINFVWTPIYSWE